MSTLRSRRTLKTRLGAVIATWCDLCAWLRGGALDAGDRAHGYHRTQQTALLVIVVLVLVETVLAHLVILGLFGLAWWTWVVLAAGLANAGWILARYLASMARRPHELGTHELRLRCGRIGEVTVPLEALLGAAKAEHGRSWAPGRLEIDRPDRDGRRDAEFVNGHARVLLHLDPSRPPRLDGRPVGVRIDRLYVSADDPARLVAAVNQVAAAGGRHIPRATPPKGNSPLTNHADVRPWLDTTAL